MKLPKMEKKKKRIVATKLPKLEKRGERNWFGPKIGGKKKNCGSQVAEIEKKNGEKLIVAMELLKMGGKKKKNCGNGVVPKLEEREREFSG